MIEIIPGILERDFSEIKKKIALVESQVNWIQIDLSDGSLYPNRTWADLTKFPNLKTRARLELHLMVNRPSKWFGKIPQPPFRRLVSQIEAKEPIKDLIGWGKKHGFAVGVALDLATPVARIVPLLEKVDFVLIMTVRAGYSGQVFAPESLAKISQVSRMAPALPIEVDGGMNPKTAPGAISSGASRIVSTSYVFQGDPPAAVKRLKNSLELIDFISSEPPR